MASEDLLYEAASDESSESELLDRSLSCWRGWSGVDEDFDPLPVDIHTASSLGQYDAVRMFIVSGKEDLTRKNLGGWTPLMYASYIGHDNVVNLLLESKVDVHAKNNKGQTALMLAASCGNESVCYFLLCQGANIEAKDKKGWTALFHATYAGHQNVVKFLLENLADKEVREIAKGYTPLMWAASEGHEIIVQYFLEFGSNVHVRGKDNNTARCLALLSGFTKIVGLIDNHLRQGISLRSEPGLVTDGDLSSSDESFRPPYHHHPRPGRVKNKGPSISEGPEALARLIGPKGSGSDAPWQHAAVIPQGYVTIDEGNVLSKDICFRDFTSPITADDHLDSCGKDAASLQDSRNSAEADEEDNAFTQTAVATVISSSSSSSGGLAGAFGLSPPTPTKEVQKSSLKPSCRPPPVETVDCAKVKSVTIDEHRTTQKPEYANSRRESGTDVLSRGGMTNDKILEEQQRILQNRPQDLQELIAEQGLLKYLPIFEEQDVDLQVFLSLTDNDLKEVGIGLLGPRRKMTNAIARWHSNVRPASHDLEQAYADKLESEMQEMAIRLQQAYEETGLLKAKVSQERELRSVTESYLMDHREAWEQVFRLAGDTQVRCRQMTQLLTDIRECHGMLVKHMSTENCRDENNDLVSNFDQKLSVKDLTEKMDSQSLLHRLGQCYEDLNREITIAWHNTDKLLGNNVTIPSEDGSDR